MKFNNCRIKVNIFQFLCINIITLLMNFPLNFPSMLYPGLYYIFNGMADWIGNIIFFIHIKLFIDILIYYLSKNNKKILHAHYNICAWIYLVLAAIRCVLFQIVLLINIIDAATGYTCGFLVNGYFDMLPQKVIKIIPIILQVIIGIQFVSIAKKEKIYPRSELIKWD